MQEIEVGEWVRLKDGRIRKFMQYLEDNFIELTKPYNIEKITDVVKHSKNVIGLIEEGDYVNKSKVVGYRIDRDDNNKRFGVLVEMENSFDSGTIDEEDIKTVATKEQMESIEYKI